MLSTHSKRDDRKLLDNSVTRLPEGLVRVTAESIAFPETCPRCGTHPATTNVRLYGKAEDDHSIRIPHCRSCGWTLKFARLVFIASIIAAVLVVPYFWTPPTVRFLGVPAAVVLLALVWIASAVVWHLFKIFYRPGVTVVASTKKSIDLAFDDRMYAEKLIDLNR